MAGETELATLLHSMQPALHDAPFIFCSLAPEQAVEISGEAWGMIREHEGVTLILEENAARSHAIAAEPAWALITLTVHSSLTAVGFLAALTSALAADGISVNAVSAWYHDHLFVPWRDRLRALSILESLARASR